jgi:hypothetical protein
MKDTETIEIDGHRYHVEAMGAKQARLVQFRLLRVFAPLASLLDKNAGAFAAAMRNADPDDYAWLCDTFAATTKVEIKAPGAGDSTTLSKPMRLSDVYDGHFKKRSKAHAEWLFFCVKVNFSDFFDAMPSDLLGVVRRATPPPMVEGGDDEHPAR